MADGGPVPAWRRTGSRRRLLLLFIVLIPTIISSNTMARLLPDRGSILLDTFLVAVFTTLFAWISVGFWTSIAGLVILLTKKDAYRVSRACDGLDLSIADRSARTAILIPIYNEEVKRVIAGLRTTYHSVRETGSLEWFDFFLLSDTTDPDVWVEEEEAWHRFCIEESAFGRVFYRKRTSNTKRKSGNVADFCRRWGKSYRYMAVFDADSIMTGETLVRLVQIMEARPDIGILQTPPKAVNRETLIARVQQFANHVYGPLLAAGLHFWQLGDAQYCGHNALIRVEPFMKHCELPRLPGKGPLSGDILSHDYVESALMCRAGYGIWLTYDLKGSWEETPPTLIDELKRDRRWCQGNLQHTRLLFTRGFFPAHRALFINGILSYGSALLWLIFLTINSAQAISEVLFEPVYMPILRKFLPELPVWRPHWAISLLGSTTLLLFLPKFLGAFPILLADFKARLYGGKIRLFLSILFEVILSMILTPIRMVFHSLFVVSTLLGKSVGWGTQSRDDRGTTWREALRAHWWGSLLGIGWGAVVYWITPSFFWWISPITFSLALSAPISVFTGRAAVGRLFRKAGLFLIPEEVELPPPLRALEDNLSRPDPFFPFPFSRKKGFLRAVVDPLVHSLHTSLLLRFRRGAPSRERARDRIVEKALACGPDSLTRKERMALLRAPHHLRELHRKVWRLGDEKAAARWGLVPPEKK
ncbi:MAG: glucans biosynthesis glucosyltransferase MdoH [Aminobacteriaceae bacterium]|jgi:membrane glycosyltransferase|nr:glucans biosynthesis glucosyltransferase MdoH [Synergistaceae bacterium]NCB15394.1 glucans biosynthesis glucosyltransferase MdoH [Synergistales bacterium]